MALADRFLDVGLKLEMTTEPLRSAGNDDMFQMDISKRRVRGRVAELFRLWPGHSSNRFEVVGSDVGARQLVLLVHEPRRAFVEKVRIRVRGSVPRESWLRQFLGANGLHSTDVLAVTDSSVTVRRHTDPRKRHYLCGMDERHLFIAQAPTAVSTVREARAALAPSDVTPAHGAKVLRQGEWFFLPASDAELEKLTQPATVIYHSASVGRGGGRPHIGEEVATLPGDPARLVRGAVRHPDHKTVQLATWHSAVVNREVRRDGDSRPGSLTSTSFGVRWVD